MDIYGKEEVDELWQCGDRCCRLRKGDESLLMVANLSEISENDEMKSNRKYLNSTIWYIVDAGKSGWSGNICGDNKIELHQNWTVIEIQALEIWNYEILGMLN